MHAPTTEAEIRERLDARRACSRHCPGWFLNAETRLVEACDSCRWPPDAAAPLYDDADVALLPEARAARIKAICCGLGRCYTPTFTPSPEARLSTVWLCVTVGFQPA